MSEFAKENLCCEDYEAMCCAQAKQLEQAGWVRSYGPDGPGWCPPDGGECVCTYDAWVKATDTPTDLHLGIDKEPPAPVYHKPF
jgi:hypothetical protein